MPLNPVRKRNNMKIDKRSTQYATVVKRLASVVIRAARDARVVARETPAPSMHYGVTILEPFQRDAAIALDALELLNYAGLNALRHRFYREIDRGIAEHSSNRKVA